LTQLPAPTLRFQANGDQGYEVVATWQGDKKGVPQGRLTQEQGERLLTVHLLTDDAKGQKALGPAMLGSYEATENQLTFKPRFSLEPGQSYRAVWKGAGQSATSDHAIPKAAAKAPPRVLKIYPTADVLPANHLKFYIYFDRPMRGGKEIFDHVELVDDKGKVIIDAWLLDEIWDEENNCLIIYIHPGRIKWGVLLRELLGPVLFENRNYSLVVRGRLTDVAGNKIGADVVKKFRTTPEDRVRIDLSQWKLTAPKAGTRELVTLGFPKAIDHRGMQNRLHVVDDSGKQVDGTITFGKEEKTWHFTPAQPWQEKAYHIDVDERLEDVAGNTPEKAFDVDLKAPKLAPQKLRFDFRCQ
jgi:hypothetical protein